MTISAQDSIDSGGAPPVDISSLLQAVTVSQPTVQSDPPVAALFHSGELNEGGNVPTGSSLPLSDEDDLYSLLCLDTSEDVATVCAGQIAGNESRFCIRPCFPRHNCCTTITKKIFSNIVISTS